MLNSELAFFAQDITLEVRSFSIEEALSEPFEALITARSTSSDVDLDAIVGYGAAFRLAAATSLTSDRNPFRVWSGLCSHAEQVRVEPDGMSTYVLRVVPMFWRTTQRRNHRIFQHVTVPDIVTEVLGGYDIDPEFRLDPSAYPRHEYRVQYGETDFAFLSRLLEEAGISYCFEQVEPKKEGELETMKVVLVDRPGDAKLRKGDAIAFVGDTEQWPEGPFVSNIRFGRQLRPGRFTIRDYDFRSSPDLKLLASVRTRVAAEERYEMYHYAPGSFLCEPGHSRRGGDGAKVNEQLGQARAEVGLDAVRTGLRSLSFRSNVADLHPGTVFRVGGYPRREVTDKTALLVVRRTIEGDVEELTDTHAQAVLASDPYRPARHTPKPRMSGVQSAVVVGPKGEEIYTDEYGRVRVQFHWDREGKHDENSSCWIRVTQAWAGSGWGITSIPRIGTEVLVDFLEGDPDLPVIIGAVHNTTCRTPYRLPDNKTKTAWKSATSPGAGGSNEITFEDARGEEKIYVHAQRDLEQKVEANETRTTGADLSTVVVKNEQREVQGDQSIVVKGDRKVSNSGQTSENASRGLAMGSGASTGVACQPGAVTMTSGQTSVMLDGPNVYIDCAGNLQLSAGRMLTLSGKQVRITGDPEVFINCHDAVRPNVRAMPAFFAGPPAREARGRGQPTRGRTGRGRGRPEDPGRAEEARVDRMRGRRRGEMPDRVRVPRGTNEQLRAQGRRAPRDGRLIDALSYDSMKRNVDRRLQYERRRLERLDRDLQTTFDRQRYHVEGLVDDLGARFQEEKKNLSEFFADVGDVFQGEAGGFKESCGALYDAFREQARNIISLRNDILDMIETERAIFKGFAEDWKDLGESAQAIFDDFKNLVEDPGDAISDWLFGDQGDLFEPALDELFGNTPDPTNVPSGGG
ncbi:MAG: type VI secretion system tip protein VgrG, partial [Deltaproteobacteria bacterium]|nr:type VI secretion system tip protein VgrG [Deltaproteobacteria bacterium]MBW2531368.1 type VI secretion system tip protein VgrG [Deltaproteobacteria bacterium]